jgi:hypothetical protein
MGVTWIQSGRFGSAAFDPLDISGCITWLDASDTATITDSSGLVDAWADKSTAGNDYTGSSTTRPTTGSATINGLNVIDLNSNNKYVVPASNYLSGETAGTIFIVAKNVGAGNRQLFLMGAAPDSFHPYGGEFYEYFGTTVRRDNIDVSAHTLTNAYVYNVAAASSDWRARINGSTVRSTGTNTVSFSILPSLGAPGNVYAYIAEVIIYDTALGSGDITSVEDYLSNKWGTP